MKRISFFFVLALAMLLQSCLREDVSDCSKSELWLRFRYTLNDRYQNLFDAEVHRVTVYLFDSDGKYVDRFSEQGDVLTNDYVMHIPLPEGEYSAVVYGGDFTTFSVGELSGQTGSLNETLRKGVTDIRDFRMELKSRSVDGYLIPIMVPDDLYAGFATHVVAAKDNHSITDVDLMKDTKRVKLKVLGIESVDEPFEVYITATNGRYKYDNNIDLNHGMFKYTPINTVNASDYQEFNLKKMRLVLGQSPMLVVRNKATQQILYAENMIEQILSTGQYTSQEDIDREDEFVFEISLAHNLVIGVFINGWKINVVTPDSAF